MDVLLVGSGGREHALAWKIAQSPRVSKVYIAPGNGGTAEVGENLNIAATDFEQLAKFAEKSVGLTVVGPDDIFAAGIVDYFTERKLRIWGPSKAAAQIESSKAFSKQLMKEAGVPTAAFEIFSDYEKARAYIREKGAPIVVKASGLALGKGVYVCETYEEAESALKEIMLDKIFKDAGNEVVIEEFLDGQEVSIHLMTDGKNYKLFPSSQDHKPVGDGDTGKNTGGMGTIAPLPWVTAEMMRNIEESIVAPTLEAMRKRGTPFQGLLYPGLKMSSNGPKVLEFNCRFGDPETQIYMRLLKSDIMDLFDACIDGTMKDIEIEWNEGAAANIVLASGGYPDAYQKGFPIEGIAKAERLKDVVVFHAGTKMENNKIVTNGGRVLGVSATGDTLKDALDRAYRAADKISFEGKQFRRDIGAKAI